jgi:hypothetical protein
MLRDSFQLGQQKTWRCDKGHFTMEINRSLPIKCAAFACVLLAGGLPRAGPAATISYSLSGDTSAVQTSINGPNEIGTLTLIDATTGLDQLPAVMLNLGDTVNGTLTLSSPLTVPGGQTTNNIDLRILHP